MIRLVEKRGEIGRRKQERQEIEFWVMRTVMCMVFVRAGKVDLTEKVELAGSEWATGWLYRKSEILVGNETV